MTTKRLSAAEPTDKELLQLQLARILELADSIADMRERAVRAIREATGKPWRECDDLLNAEAYASAQPRWIASFEPKGKMPSKICEPAKRTARIIFEEMEERLKEAGVTRKTDKTLSAIPGILERLVQYAINAAVHDAADAPEGDQG